MKRLQAQIKKTQEKLAKLREDERRAKLRAVKPARTKKPSGRPKLDEQLLIRAVEMAETKTLSDVADRLNVSLSSLYRYGIKRYILEAQNRRKAA